MDKITSIKSHAKLSQWARLIAECQNSDMTIKEWCCHNGISKDQYYYWLRKVREDSVAKLQISNSGHPENMAIKSESKVSFQKLSVSVPSCSPKAAVTIHMSDVTLEIAEGTSQQTVEAVLRALRSL